MDALKKFYDLRGIDGAARDSFFKPSMHAFFLNASMQLCFVIVLSSAITVKTTRVTANFLFFHQCRSQTGLDFVCYRLHRPLFFGV